MEDKALQMPPVKKEKKLPIYLDTCKPQTWLFEGNTPGQVKMKAAHSPLDSLYNLL